MHDGQNHSLTLLDSYSYSSLLTSPHKACVHRSHLLHWMPLWFFLTGLEQTVHGYLYTGPWFTSTSPESSSSQKTIGMLRRRARDGGAISHSNWSRWSNHRQTTSTLERTRYFWHQHHPPRLLPLEPNCREQLWCNTRRRWALRWVCCDGYAVLGASLHTRVEAALLSLEPQRPRFASVVQLTKQS